MKISVAARNSPLSKAQVAEVENALQRLHPNITFISTCIETTGDKDQHTSLRSLDKTDFFTKEVDALVSAGHCRLAIHSAKDLPANLPKGLSVIAITQGLDPADALIIRSEKQQGKISSDLLLKIVKSHPKIATSSVRRENEVKRLLPHAVFLDLRGTIQQRLALLEEGIADGVVIAEAALIRLKLTAWTRFLLPGETVPLQGKIAIVARYDDLEMKELLSIL